MLDPLMLVTQASSTVTFVLLASALGATFIAVTRQAGGERVSKSMLLFSCYLLLFLFAVGFMSLYHWLSSEGMEVAWYLALIVSMAFGVASSAYALLLFKRKG